MNQILDFIPDGWYLVGVGGSWILYDEDDHQICEADTIEVMSELTRNVSELAEEFAAYQMVKAAQRHGPAEA